MMHIMFFLFLSLCVAFAPLPGNQIGDQEWGAWLKKIVINKSLDKLRAKQQYFLTIDEAKLEVVADDDTW